MLASRMSGYVLALAMCAGCAADSGRVGAPGPPPVYGPEDPCVAWVDHDQDGWVIFDEPCWHASQGAVPEGYTATDCNPSRTSDWQDCVDCDDDDPTIYPWRDDAPYDGIDQDCLGGEGEYDADYDGHDALGYGGDDCEDDNALAFPGAPEWCGDGADGDCDGQVDEAPCGRASLLQASTGVTGEAEDQVLGFDVTWIDGGDADTVGLAIGENAPDGEHQVVVVPFPPSGLHPVGEVATATVGGAMLLGAAADFTGDGVDDLVLQPAHADVVGILAGPVLVDMDAPAFVWSVASSEGHPLGDVTGDGVRDLDAGAAIYAGPFGVDAPVEPVATINSDWGNREFLESGDVDGDGVGDVLVGGHGGVGAPVVVLSGPIEGDVHLSELPSGDPQVLGGHLVGDADGDGRVDLLMGSATTGELSLQLDPLGADASTVTLAFTGVDACCDYGSLGDLDGDGDDEVWVGSTSLLVFAGPYAGTIEAVDGGFLLVGPGALPDAPTVAAGRDGDGDGVADAWLGFPRENDWRGAVWFLSGATVAAGL